MDARSAAAAFCLYWLLTTVGCVPLNTQPGARPEEREGSPSEEGVVVRGQDKGGDIRSATHVEPNVDDIERWIEQIQRRDDLAVRARPRPVIEALTPGVTSGSDSGLGQSGIDSAADGEMPPDEQPLGPPGAVSGPAGPGEPPGHSSGAATPPPPPALAGVSARAAESPTAATPGGEQPSPAVNASVQATGQPLTLQEFADGWLARPTDPSFRDQLDRRLLSTLAGNDEEARRPLEMVSTEQQQMAASFIDTMIAIRDVHGGEPGPEAARVLAALGQLQQSLVPLSDLQIATIAVARAVGGYGRYEPIDPPHFPTGRENEFVVYCELSNFLSRLTDGGRYESRFSMRTTVLSRAGDVILEINDEHIVDTCRTRRRDCFIPRLVRVPATLSPGQYVVKVTIVDKIAEKVAERQTTFRILARS